MESTQQIHLDERVEYSKKAIETTLLNWGQVSEATDERLVIVRADLSLAVSFLSKRDQHLVRRVQAGGEGSIGFLVVTRNGESRSVGNSVSPEDWVKIINRLYVRLNILGLGEE